MKQQTVEEFLRTMSKDSRSLPVSEFRKNARIRIMNVTGTFYEIEKAKLQHSSRIARIIRWIAALGTAITMLGSGVVYASQSATPGDLLYPVKRASEDVALTVAPSDRLKTSVATEVVDRRAKEIQELEQKNKPKNIPDAVKDYEDTVQEMTSTHGVNTKEIEQHVAKHESLLKKTEEKYQEEEDHNTESETKKVILTPSPSRQTEEKEE